MARSSLGAAPGGGTSLGPIGGAGASVTSIQGGCPTINGTQYAAPFAAASTAVASIVGSLANVYGVMAQACRITALYAVAPGGFAASAGAVVTLTKNGVDQALTVTTAVVNTVVSATGSVSFAAGDKYSIKLVDTSANFVIWGLAVQ